MRVDGGVIAHRGLGAREVVTVRGVPVTGLVQTWLDLAPFVALDDLVVIGDAVAGRSGGTGGWLATSDLVWREAKVVGEYQGAGHFADYARGDKDIVRRRSLEAIGWTYVDFTKDDYFRQSRRLELVRRVAEGLGCTCDPQALARISASAGLPGGPLRACGG